MMMPTQSLIRDGQLMEARMKIGLSQIIPQRLQYTIRESMLMRLYLLALDKFKLVFVYYGFNIS